MKIENNERTFNNFIMSNSYLRFADHPTRSSLILGMKFYDNIAWDRFVDLYGPQIYCWCRVRGLQPSDAHDVGQETFASVAKTIGTFERTGSFRGWLWTITQRKIIDHFRRGVNQSQGVGGSDFQQRIQEIPDNSLEEPSSVDAGSSSLLLRALNLIRRDFDESTWNAFWGMVMDDKSGAEMAAEQGWTTADGSGNAKDVSRVRQAKRRVVKRIRDEFGVLLGDIGALQEDTSAPLGKSEKVQ